MAADGGWGVPGYREVRELGAGGGGRVVLAVHEETGTHVAIKYLAGHLRGEPGFLDRFQDEARLLFGLHGEPNIARLYEYVQNPGGAAIVMELVDGVSLRAILRENGATGPEAALAVLKGSLLGLAAAHALGVVHRDYKPENIVVTGEGASKLVDFGIAVRAGGGEGAAGTPPYMAPEQWAGAPGTPASDVYAATAVFYECLTGHRPFRATTPDVLRYQHEHEPVPLAEVPEPVRGLLATGMAKDPAARPAGALHLVVELERIARAAYGDDWEDRGRRRLAELALLLVSLFPGREQGPPSGGSTLFRTVLHGVRDSARRNAARLTAGVAAVAIAAGVAGYVLAAEPAAQRIGVVAAAPSETAGRPGPAGLVSPPAETTGSEDPPAPQPGEDPVSGDPGGYEDTSETPVASDPSASPGDATTGPTDPSGTPTPTPTPTTAAKVTDLQVTARMAGGDLRAEVTLTADSESPVTLRTDVVSAGRTVAGRTATLTGDTSYQRRITHTFTEPPCGTTVEVRVAAGERTATAQVPVTCPPAVESVSVQRASVGAKGDATATVAVRTAGQGQVTLKVTFTAGERSAVRTLRLSGAESYTRSVSVALGRVPCGTAWRVAAATTPGAANGQAGASGTTEACPPEPTEEPTEGPQDPEDPQVDTPPADRPEENPRDPIGVHDSVVR
ncbi:serine/threonine protein kinase [Spongiactinospora rosea]|uniref:non-specific serine/threonine protein kinase n=1 Tax=Spongiactinospora rosea TaxID=2248750 RepID=A0A366LWM1_9ACTN|nr:serine/threonine-protein kinase [Spongiactinospora rosea]RBQ17592.1 serine/threonine protein kinase [Spongiactinospora rosea]